MSEKYKLVPVEPTKEMLAAYCGAQPSNIAVYLSDGVEPYKAMLAAAPAVQVEQEPVAYKFADDWGRTRIVLGKETAEHWTPPGETIEPLYAAPQPAEQQPDVTLLLELLSHARCNTCDGSEELYDNHGHPHQCQWCHDRSKALAAHRKGGDA